MWRMLDGLDRIMECAFCAGLPRTATARTCRNQCGCQSPDSLGMPLGSGWLELVKEPVDVTERPVTGATFNSPADFVASGDGAEMVNDPELLVDQIGECLVGSETLPFLDGHVESE